MVSAAPQRRHHQSTQNQHSFTLQQKVHYDMENKVSKQDRENALVLWFKDVDMQGAQTTTTTTTSTSHHQQQTDIFHIMS